MTVWEDREPDQPSREETASRAIDWKGTAVAAGIILAVIALLVFVSGCTPSVRADRPMQPGWPRPEASLEVVPAATGKVTTETEKVTTSAGTIKGTVASLVQPVREVATVAPVPAATISKGHEVIYAAATDAEAAALEARAQVRVVEQAVSTTEASLKALHEAHQREIKALGQQVDQLTQDNLKLHEAASKESSMTTRKLILAGGVLLALGIAGGIYFRSMAGVAVAAGGAGVMTIAFVVQALMPYAEYIAWSAVAIGGVAALYKAGLLDRTATAAIDGYDTAKAAVRQAVANTGTTAMAVEAAIDKVGNDAKVNMPEPVRMEIWRRRKG
jgi:hypothetical protein